VQRSEKQHSEVAAALVQISGASSEHFSASVSDPDYSMGFKSFLQLLSKVRAWDTSNLREELRPLYDRLERRRKSTGVEKVIGVAEVSYALEVLGLAPRKIDEQVQLFRFLEDVNEWGFEPVTLEFEAFVRFIRRVKERRSLNQSVEDKEYVVTKLRFNERLVSEYRVVFDIVDVDGLGELNVAGVRRAVQLVRKKNMSSEELREIFRRTDKDGNGSVSFREFMHLIYELSPPPPPNIGFRSFARRCAMVRDFETPTEGRNGR